MPLYPSTYWREDWVGHRPGLMSVEKLLPWSEMNTGPSSIHPVARHYTDWAAFVPVALLEDWKLVGLLYTCMRVEALMARLLIYLIMLPPTWNIYHQITGWQWKINWTGHWRKWSWFHLWYSSSICLDGLKNTMEDLRQDSQVSWHRFEQGMSSIWAKNTGACANLPGAMATRISLLGYDAM
jgi:hypothetical protein